MSLFDAILGEPDRLSAAAHGRLPGLADVCGLAAACAAAPGELTRYAILADAVQEGPADDPMAPAVAFALRWCAATGRYPGRRTDVARDPWVWVRESTRPTRLAYTLARAFPHAVVPAPAWGLLSPFDGRPHWGGAVVVLAQSLWPLVSLLRLKSCQPTPDARIPSRPRSTGAPH